MSVRSLTAELTRVKAPLIVVVTEKPDLPTKLDAVAVESHKKLGRWDVVGGSFHRIERLVRTIVDQTIETLDAFAGQIITQSVDCFRNGLENAYAGSKLAFSYTLTHVDGVGKILFTCRDPLLLVGKVETLLVRVRRRLFMKNRRLLERKDPVVV